MAMKSRMLQKTTLISHHTARSSTLPPVQRVFGKNRRKLLKQARCSDSNNCRKTTTQQLTNWKEVPDEQRGSSSFSPLIVRTPFVNVTLTFLSSIPSGKFGGDLVSLVGLGEMGF